MARIPILQLNDANLTPDQKACLDEAQAARGRLLNIHRALANRPEAARAVQGLIQTVYRKNSTLDVRHGELAYLTATAVNDCYY
jgi:alkylhydroperoxidase family enzyme